MLSKDENEILTRVGPGTLMGNLLRRYWTPCLLSEELPEPDCPPVRVRILGEDLVAFRDTSGKVGLFKQACPHRGASMFFGRNEEAGLRCVYHGWKFDVTGACVDMPSEPAESNFKTKVRITAYPVHESGGVVWGYLGPQETMVGFRDFGTDAILPEHWNAWKSWSNCNWIQRLEGNIDPAHPSWLHMYNAARVLPEDGTDRPGTFNSVVDMWRIWAFDGAPRVEVEDTWYGFRSVGLRHTPNGNTHARIQTFVIPYAEMGRGIGVWTVPIDDENCYFFGFSKGAGLALPGSPYAQHPSTRSFGGPENRLFTPENDYQIDRNLQRTAIFSGVTHFDSQDMMVTESMGTISDKTAEHLGTSDRAIIRMRRLLIDAAKALEKGTEPPAIDPDLPFRDIGSGNKVLDKGEDWRSVGKGVLAGQPSVPLLAPEVEVQQHSG